MFTVGCPKYSAFLTKFYALDDESIKKGHPLKSPYFTTIGSSSVYMVADRYRHAAYHNKH